ncbi:MAG: DUF3108 domain-containing protein [Gammaproteobacteria bacterium]|nr:DUF3108 domain-containing protein [Gammaproteobacteria bacterium]
MFKLISLFIVFFISPMALGFELPPNHQAVYSLDKMDTTIGQVTMTLNKKGQKIIYTSSTEPKGFIALVLSDSVEESSILEWPESLNAPRLLSYQLFKNKKYKKNQRIKLDWHDNQSVSISATYKNQSHALQHTGNLWGRQTMQLPLISELLTGNNSDLFNYTVVDKGTLSEYQYQRLGNATIKIEKKSYATVKFKISRNGSNRYTYIWFAPEYNYLPVYIEQRKNNEVNVSMSLKTYQPSITYD